MIWELLSDLLISFINMALIKKSPALSVLKKMYLLDIGKNNYFCQLNFLITLRPIVFATM